MIDDRPHLAVLCFLPDHGVGYDDDPVEDNGDDDKKVIEVFTCAQKVEKCKKLRKS